MAEIINNVLHLVNGRKISLTGRVLAILPTLELAECFTMEFFCKDTDSPQVSAKGKVLNPHALNQWELAEIATYHIELWALFLSEILDREIDDVGIFRLPPQ